MRRTLPIAALLVLALACRQAATSPILEDPGPVHIHGLGVDPADGALYMATHSGLFRAGPGELRPARVADRYQDTMGFTVVGPHQFLGSGHPDLREAREKDLPPLLGLLESDDAGLSWRPVSLLGNVDFHDLEVAEGRVLGYDASGERLLVSGDGGQTWVDVTTPAGLIDFAVDPSDPDRLVASTEAGLFASSDGGSTWSSVGAAFGLLAWPSSTVLFLVDFAGGVQVSADRGGSFRPAGDAAAETAAAFSPSENELYLALHDGRVVYSMDGGKTFTLRATP